MTEELCNTGILSIDMSSDCLIEFDRFCKSIALSVRKVDYKKFGENTIHIKLMHLYKQDIGKSDEYKNLWEVVKIVCTVFHRQASSKRVFTLNKNQKFVGIDEEGDLLIHRRRVQDYAKRLNLNPNNFNISNAMRNEVKKSSERQKQEDASKLFEYKETAPQKRKSVDEIADYKRLKKEIEENITNYTNESMRLSKLAFNENADRTLLGKAVEYANKCKNEKKELEILKNKIVSLQSSVRNMI